MNCENDVMNWVRVIVELVVYGERMKNRFISRIGRHWKFYGSCLHCAWDAFQDVVGHFAKMELTVRVIYITDYDRNVVLLTR